MSPYEILFGRPRPLGSLPYTPPRECEDANAFVARMSNLDKVVGTRLNEMHQKLAQRLNKNRPEGTIFQVGSSVWYRRPEGTGDKLDSRWLGPALVKGREGKRSYVIELKPGTEIKAHGSF